jgi:hypothetical protein
MAQLNPVVRPAELGHFSQQYGPAISVVRPLNFSLCWLQFGLRISASVGCYTACSEIALCWNIRPVMAQYAPAWMTSSALQAAQVALKSPLVLLSKSLSQSPSFLSLKLSPSTHLQTHKWAMCVSLSPSASFYLSSSLHLPWDVCPALGLNSWDWGCHLWVGPHSPLSGAPPFGQGPTLH